MAKHIAFSSRTSGRCEEELGAPSHTCTGKLSCFPVIQEMPDYSPWETDEVRDKGHLHVQVCGKLPCLSLCLSSGLRPAFPILLWLSAYSFPSSSPALFPTLSSSPVHYYEGATDFGGSFLLVRL